MHTPPFLTYLSDKTMDDTPLLSPVSTTLSTSIIPGVRVRTYGKRARGADAFEGALSLSTPSPLAAAVEQPVSFSSPFSSYTSALRPPLGLASFLGISGARGAAAAAASAATLTTTTTSTTLTSPPLGAHRGATQLHIDLGQKVFDATTCLACGVVSCPGDVGDARAHARVCASAGAGASGGIKGGVSVLLPWGRPRSEAPLSYAQGESIAVFRAAADDAAGVTARGATLCARLASELGVGSAPPREAISSARSSLFVALNTSGALAGALVAVRAGRGAVARRLTARFDASRGDALELTVSPQAIRTNPILVISQIWVAPSARRSGVGRALLDAATKHAIYAYVVVKEDIAFTNPTADGYRLAVSYLGTKEVPCTDGAEVVIQEELWGGEGL